MQEEMTRRRFVKLGAVMALTVGAGLAARDAFETPELELRTTRMGEGTMKTLVVYGTKSGCTEGIAERIGRQLAEHGATVEVVAAEKAPAADGFDAVVVGSGVRAGGWHGTARSWVEKNAAALKAMPVAFYTCGLTLANDPTKTDEVRAYTHPLIDATGIKPVDIGLFAGWNQADSFGFAERTVLKLMKAPQGDFRDWAAIDAWAEQVAPSLSA